MHTVRDAVTLAFAALLVVLVCGCPNPNTYGTPRTTPKGEAFHTVAVEAYHAQGTFDGAKLQPDGSVRITPEDVTRTTPHLPTYMLRYGVSREVDLGFRAVNLSSPAFDVKWNFKRSEAVDIAIDPGAQYAPIATNLHIVHLHAPLLFGFNVSESATLVLTAGGLVTLSAGDPPDTAREQMQTASGISARLGVGANFRLSDQLALHPEVTATRRFDDSGLTWITFGVGFSFGSLPRYRVNPALQETE